MINDVKEAAERLRVCENQAHLYILRVKGHVGQTIERDRGILARAYLAEHPADDGEAVTAEWLEVVGLSDAIELPEQFGIQFYPDGYAGLWYYYGPGKDLRIECKTRGDVRRLCKALGIELKESGDE